MLPLSLLAKLLLWGLPATLAREHSGAGIFDPSLATVLSNQSRSKGFLAFRWKAPLWYSPDSFHIDTQATPCDPGEPPPTTVSVVACGEVWTDHWPHFAELLFPCWSFFRQYPSARWYLLRLPKLTRNVPLLRSRLQLFGIEYVDAVPEQRCSVRKVITRNHLRDGFRGTEGPLSFLRRADALAFQAILLNASSPMTQHPSSSGISIGILNRRGSRRLLRTDTLRRQLLSLCPGAHISELDDIDTLAFPDQCQWVHQQAIIIAPHGAQLTNIVCGAPCTSLLEIFPAKYFLPGYFQPLATLLGMHAFGVYPDLKPYEDSERCMKSYWCRTWAQAANIPLHPMLRELLPRLFQARLECLSRSSQQLHR